MDTPDEIVPFSHPEFGELRVLTINGEQWFVAKDVCGALGLGRQQDSTRYLDADEKGECLVNTTSGDQQMVVVSEPGFYKLVMKSRKPVAKAFQRWVTHDVLPTIHAHGGYLTPRKVEEVLTDPDTIIRLATELKNERLRADLLEAENERMLPAARQAEAFLDASGDYTVTQAAGLLSQVDRSMTRKRLFALLRADEMVEKRSCRATAKAVRRGYLRNIATAYTDGDGGRRLRDPYAVVTPKGLDWMARTYCGAYQPRLPMVV